MPSVNDGRVADGNDRAEEGSQIPVQMPKGFYLIKGIWYKRILNPDTMTGTWRLQAESISCKEVDRQKAIDYIAGRSSLFTMRTESIPHQGLYL